jgi:hypothetical protein
MGTIDLLAVLIAAVASFIVGGPWYSPVLFLAPWSAAAGTQPAIASPGRVYPVTFVLTLVTAAALAWFLGPDPAVGRAVVAGIVAGALIVAASMAINYQFAGRSLAHWGIDAAFHTVRFAVMGLVLGHWP